MEETAGAVGRRSGRPTAPSSAFAMGGQVRRVSVQGGRSDPICELPPGDHFHSGTWSPDGEVVVFSSGPERDRLYQVAARGGNSSLLMPPEEFRGQLHAVGWSHFLPAEAGARVLVFTLQRTAQETMMIQNLESGQREILGRGSYPFYSPRRATLCTKRNGSPASFGLSPFSLDTLQATGGSLPHRRKRPLPDCGDRRNLGPFELRGCRAAIGLEGPGRCDDRPELDVAGRRGQQPCAVPGRPAPWPTPIETVYGCTTSKVGVGTR